MSNRLTKNYQFSLHTLTRKIKEDLIAEIDSVLNSNSRPDLRASLTYTLENKLGAAGYVFTLELFNLPKKIGELLSSSVIPTKHFRRGKTWKTLNLQMSLQDLM